MTAFLNYAAGPYLSGPLLEPEFCISFHARFG